MSKTVLFQTIDVKTVPFGTIQFSISTLFKCQKSSISSNSVRSLILFTHSAFYLRSLILFTHSACEALPLRARVDPGAMAKKEYSEFPTIRLFCVICRTLVGRVLPHGKDSAGAFYSPIRLGKMTDESGV